MPHEIDRRAFIKAATAVGLTGTMPSNAQAENTTGLQERDIQTMVADTWEDFRQHKPNGPTLYLVVDSEQPGIELYFGD